MKVTLIVESNDQLRSIYNLNLKTWVGSDSYSVKYASQFKALYSVQDQVDLIIVKARCGSDERSAETVYSILQELKVNIPMIIIGESEVPYADNIVHLPSGLEIQPLVKQAAFFLGVTAKEMANLSVGDYFPVSIEFFNSNLPRSVVPIFKKDGEQYHMLFSEYQDFDQNIVLQHISKGTMHFYVKSKDRLKLAHYVTAELVALIPAQEMNEDDAIKAQQMSMGLLTDKLNRMGITKETVELSRRSIKGMMTHAKKNPKLGTLVGKLLQNKASYQFKHTQVLTAVSLHLMENIDWGNEEQKQKIAFVSFFHDIVLSSDEMCMIKTEAQLKASTLSAKEKELVSRHAQLSAELVSKFPSAPMGADIIIRQHHGVNHGVGFSETYGGNLSPMSILLILAEDFTDGVLRAGEGHFDIIGKITEMRERYPTQRFQKIIDILDRITV